MPGKTNPRLSRPEPHEGYVAVGYIRGPHGLEGELRVESLSDNPERFQVGAVLRAGDGSLTIRSLRPHRGALLVCFEGIDTRERAHEVRGLLLEIPETDLVPLASNQYYRHQLIGLTVRDSTGNELGTLEEVLDTGANDVYVVSDGDSELLIPAIETVVRDVDVSTGIIVVEPLQGLERRPLRKKDA